MGNINNDKEDKGEAHYMKKIWILCIATVIIVFCFQVKPNQALADTTDLQEQIIYDILVDRYNNGSQKFNEQIRLDDPLAYHGGDLKGITMKLDAIQEMGFTAIQLSPIMDNAADGYHGYWVDNMMELEDLFGNMDDLKHLVKEAHGRNMKVILEFPLNYMAKTSPIIADETHQDWTKELDQEALKDQPWADKVVALNQDNPDVASYLQQAGDYWIDEAGVDGYKLHAADQSSTDFLNTFTKRIKENDPDFYLIAGTITDTNSDVLNGMESIDMVENDEQFRAMKEVFSNPDIPVSKLYESWLENENQSGLLYVDNKQLKRFTQVFAENGRNKMTVWQLALTYMYTAPGIPVIYQGSEIPMYGDYPDNQRLVDFNSGDADLKEFMERISALRNEFPALSYGDFELIDSDQGMSVFSRSYQDQTVYIAINNDSESRSVSIQGIDPEKQLRGLLGDNLVRANDQGHFKIGISRESAEVYIIQEDTGINWVFIGVIVGIFVLFVISVIYLGRKQKKREAMEDKN